MKDEAELTLIVLERYLKHGPSLSPEDLCAATKAPETKIKYILLVLEKRGYLTKAKDADEYALSKKIVMLV